MKNKAIGTIAAVVIAGLTYFLGYTTDLGQAIKIATNQDSAVQACKELIEGKATEAQE